MARQNVFNAWLYLYLVSGWMVFLYLLLLTIKLNIHSRVIYCYVVSLSLVLNYPAVIIRTRPHLYGCQNFLSQIIIQLISAPTDSLLTGFRLKQKFIWFLPLVFFFILYWLKQNSAFDRSIRLIGPLKSVREGFNCCKLVIVWSNRVQYNTIQKKVN